MWKVEVEKNQRISSIYLTVKSRIGYVMSEFDGDVKVGDLITGYHAGFHRVTEIKERFYTKDDEDRYSHSRPEIKEGQQYKSLIFYKTVMSANYKPSKAKKEKACDAHFCEKLDKDTIEARRKQLLDEINAGTDALLGLV